MVAPAHFGGHKGRTVKDDLGFWIEESVLVPHECDRLTERVCRDVAKRSRAGARHLMSDPAVSELAHDSRLAAMARAGLGGSATPLRATLFEKSGQSNWLVVWHQDTALPLASRFESSQWGPWSEKAGIHYAHAPAWALARVLALRVHLDESAEDNGPLRVVPGSHRLGVLSDDDVFRVARERPSQTCVVGRGGILAMRPLLIHSSSKSASAAPRRVLHLEYADSLDLAPGIRLAVA
jgi:ectoine hydroxylase-related dioxygenase (phytanoyl-CoA dioxygenase family)